MDCKLGPWKDKGGCTATCGTSAVKIMTRLIVQNALYGGKECEGRTEKTENCGFEPCPSKPLFINLYLYLYMVSG